MRVALEPTVFSDASLGELIEARRRTGPAVPKRSPTEVIQEAGAFEGS